MNLKYYLKGLGLGIIVTGIILGIHNRGNNKSMTDAEIKARATELGMVDANSKLVGDDEDVSAEDLLENLEEEQKTAQEEAVETVESSKEDPVVADEEESVDSPEADTDVKTQEDENEVELENTRIDSVTDADDDPDKKNNIEETADEAGDTSQEETAEEEPAPAQEDEDEDADTTTVVTGGTVLTINSGDSSEKVAKKLAELGLVLNASEYDTFLCTYGYDRYIRVGTYTIPDGASNEEIAKIITGKQ